MSNEQNTESLTRQLMNFEVGKNTGFMVYAQTIDKNLSIIKNCLDKAGGKPKKCKLNEYNSISSGTAKPEYVITYDEDPNTIIVIECKASEKNHHSADYSEPKKYAVDGALYYAKYLKEEFNVIAIGVSGTKIDKYKSTSYYWKKSENTPKEIEKTRNILLTPQNYINLLTKKKLVKKFSIEEIKIYASKFNELMRNELQIIPQERIFFIASCLLALQDKTFSNDYQNAVDISALIDNLVSAVERVLRKAKINSDKLNMIKANAEQIKNYSKLTDLENNKDGSLMWFLKQLELVITPMMNDADSHQDALGIFYHEFIKYTAGGAGNELGIVLTPEHLCDFMCELADIQKTDRVIDICCGTGSFLVAAMKHMISKADNDEEIKHIKQNNLYGIEISSSIFPIAVTNMIIRGEGQSHIYNADSLKSTSYKNNNIPQCSIGLLNPPYSQKKDCELKFVKQMLDKLAPRAVGIVVVPVSCAIGTKFKDERKELFEHHTLDAVFSMPNDIFYPVGTVVCVMKWIAHVKHDPSKKTFFGYCKDDGFVKRKNLGRVDAFGRWAAIKDTWLNMYFNKIEEDEKASLHCVTADDEWLAEAYINTDYRKLKKSDFQYTLNNFIAYLVKANKYPELSVGTFQDISFDINNWKPIKVGKLFVIHPTEFFDGITAEDCCEKGVPLVVNSAENNGVAGFCDVPPTENGNIITFSDTTDGNTFFFQPDPFIGFAHVQGMYPKHKQIKKHVMLFIITVLMFDSRGRYNYGRKMRRDTISEIMLHLPIQHNSDGSILIDETHSYSDEGYVPDWQFMENYIKSLPYGDRI